VPHRNSTQTAPPQQLLKEWRRELVTGCSSQGAFSTTRGPIPELAADNEEADTRLILHALEAVKSGYKRIVVKCRDTDVLLMLVHFLGARAEVWMLSETSYDTKCYPAHTIYQKIEPEAVENLLGFHAVTGCDTVSLFAGHGKKSRLAVFLQHPELLKGVGRDGAIPEVEQFVCHLYGAPDVRQTDATCQWQVQQTQEELVSWSRKQTVS